MILKSDLIRHLVELSSYGNSHGPKDSAAQLHARLHKLVGMIDELIDALKGDDEDDTEELS